MSPVRSLMIFGTRPEAIKMAPLVLAARRRTNVRPIVCVTGQHREMLDQVLRYFGIQPDIDLQLMQPNQSLTQLAARCLGQLGEVIDDVQPDCVLGQGDTTTALCAGMAAFFAQIPFVHVEAGLRTNRINSPFPEEFQRRVCSLATTLHCAPTEAAAAQLKSEGYTSDSVVVTGNTVLDALLQTAAWERANNAQWVMRHHTFAGRPMILVTAHRRENHGDGIQGICTAVQRLVAQFPDLHVVWPVHLNPHISGPVHTRLGKTDRIHLLPPADYAEFVWLMDQATLVISDSGGVQEEAPSLRTPVLVTRESTERPEALAAGVTRLVGTDPGQIVAETVRLLSSVDACAEMQGEINPYGDGQAAERILNEIVNRLTVAFAEPSSAVEESETI